MVKEREGGEIVVKNVTKVFEDKARGKCTH